MSRFEETRLALAAQMTPRLAYFFAVLVALLVGYLVVTLHDMRVLAADRLETVQRELAVVSQPDGLTVWQERSEAARAARQSWEERRWTGETSGIASAEAQAALGGILARSNLGSIKLSVSSDPVEVGPDQLLRYEISGIGDSHVLISLLIELTTAQQSYIISEISAPLRERQRSRINIGGYVPYQPATSSGEAQE